MNEIRERAIAKYCTHCGARTEYNCSADKTPCHDIRNYIKIATEQKAVDDELLKRVHKGVLCKAIREKKGVAMKAYCKRCLDMCGGYPCSHKCSDYIEYAKTLEE